jgi:polysaccharide chain length determinant protein (PEP-CTERM system associated)
MDQQILQQALYYINGVWRRRWWVVVVAWFVSLAGWAFVSTMSDYYESSARIYVDTSSILRPLLSGITVDDNIENEVSFIQRTLTSRPNLEKIASMTDLDVTVITATEMERLLERIQKNTTITKQGENLFHIGYRAPDPILAKNVVQSYLTLFVESNLGQSREDRDSAQEFLEDQIKNYEAQLTEAEMRLARFKQDNAGLLPGERGYEANVGRSQDEVRRKDGEYRSAVERRDILKKQLKDIPETIEVATGDGSAGGPPSQIDVRILEIEDHIEKLLQRYTESHPDIRVLKGRLTALREEREAEIAAFANPTGPGSEANKVSTYSVPNKVYEQVKLSLVEAEAQISLLKSQLDRAREEITELESKAAQVPEIEAALTRLNRDYAVIKRNHDALLERRESARLSRARELKSEEVQFRVVEPPIVPNLPNGPQRATFIMATIVVAIGAGIGVAGFFFVLSGAISSVAGLREQLGVPLLGIVSVVESAGAKHLKRLNVAACFGALIMLFVVCGALLMVERQYGLANILPQQIAGAGRML